MSGGESPMTPLTEMTDVELDARLVRLYNQHRAASMAQRAGWHGLICDVLKVQAERRDLALGLQPLDLVTARHD
jgi:hypothetical protein